MSTSYIGIKANYNRKTKSYDIDQIEVETGEVITALNSRYIIGESISGLLLHIERTNWKGICPPASIDALKNYLQNKLANMLDSVKQDSKV